ncbi:MAG: AbrB/MazE/SpoVT family DNA-binding domain-containing protein [Beijerinckiaceae bacterium]|jgi:antitoxin ChpS
MHIAKLCKAKGSIILTLPRSLLEEANLRAGDTVGLSIEAGRLVIEPHPKSQYTLDKLLAASDYSTLQPLEEREWIDAPASGLEQL